jgi:uncharacterized protein (TIGR03435 family)
MTKRTRRIFALMALSGSAFIAQSASAQNIAGTWQGTLHLPPGRDIRLVMKVTRADDESLKGVFYSIDQNPTPLNASTFTLQGATVKFGLTPLGATYEGKLAADGNTIEGTFTQGNPLPLNFTKATADTAWAIPEPPPPPKIMDADVNPEFEVATIKPSNPETPGRRLNVANDGRMTTVNTDVNFLIQFAFNLHPKQIEGGGALLQEKFDIAGKPDHPGMGNDRQIRAMMRGLLKDRFQLTYHMEKKEMSVYSVTVAKGGPKLTKSAVTGIPLPSLGMGPRALNVRNGTIEDLAALLQGNLLERPVVNQTGLTDRFDITLKFTPDASQRGPAGAGAPPEQAPAANDPDAPPDLFTAFQQQLGLKLESTKAPVDVLVIDKIEKPSGN